MKSLYAIVLPSPALCCRQSEPKTNNPPQNDAALSGE
jgi:hypothetical protein